MQWNNNIVKYFYNWKSLFSIEIYFKMVFIYVIAKLNFQQSLLQSLGSHDPSEICWFAAQKYISYFYLWWKQMGCLIFLWKPWCI